SEQVELEQSQKGIPITNVLKETTSTLLPTARIDDSDIKMNCNK
ncbi:11150_t:CDS:1, partial [Acaulospora colombiana]